MVRNLEVLDITRRVEGVRCQDVSKTNARTAKAWFFVVKLATDEMILIYLIINTSGHLYSWYIIRGIYTYIDGIYVLVAKSNGLFTFSNHPIKKEKSDPKLQFLVFQLLVFQGLQVPPVTVNSQVIEDRNKREFERQQTAFGSTV